MKQISLVFLLFGIIQAQGTVEYTSFYSDALGASRSVGVYLPDGYYSDDSLDYPVVYFLHGLGGNHASYTEIYGWLDNMIGNQIIYPVIVVKPDGSCNPFGGSMYTNSELYGNFEDYIVYDLVEFIDTNYRTMASMSKRAITGHSMGGYGSMKAALKHPDIYRCAASNSGPLDIILGASLAKPYVLQENGGTPPYHYQYNAGAATNLMFVFSGGFSPDITALPYYVDYPLDSLGEIDETVIQRWTEHNPSHLAAQIEQEECPAIYFDCGNQDEFFCYPTNIVFKETLNSLGLNYRFRSFAGSHSLVYNSFSISMAFLDSVTKSSTGVPGEASRIPDNISLSQNYPNPFNASTIIKFDIPEESDVTIEIYDILGKRVDTLLNARKQVGHYQIIWDAKDMASGVYFYKLNVGGYVESKKMLLCK